MLPATISPAHPGSPEPHVYRSHCRCVHCRVEKNARKRRTEAGNPQKVSAESARLHIAELRAKGLGIRQIARLAQTYPGHIQAIASGRYTQIWRTSRDRILAVQPVKAGGQWTSSWRARRILDALLAEGYAEEYLLRVTGLRSLELGAHVRLSTARRLEAIHRRLTE